LLACCDADGLFTMIETSYAGRNSDEGIFKASAMKYWIQSGELDNTTPSPLTYDENYSSFPYYFVVDEAFPLSRYLMILYPRSVLANVKRIYNYRISRARKTIECTFGMVCEKFAVLNGHIRIREPVNVNFVIKAACVLHNYVRKLEGLPYVSTSLPIPRTVTPMTTSIYKDELTN
ncbi:protein ALP1-like, partial [Aphis craccivora]